MWISGQVYIHLKNQIEFPFLHCLLSPLVFLSRFFSCIFLFLLVSAPDAVSFCCCCFTPLFPPLSLPFLKALHPFLFSLTLVSHFWKISSDISPITYNSGKWVWTSCMWRWKGILKILKRCWQQKKARELQFPFLFPLKGCPESYQILTGYSKCSRCQAWND